MFGNGRYKAQRKTHKKEQVVEHNKDYASGKVKGPSFTEVPRTSDKYSLYALKQKLRRKSNCSDIKRMQREHKQVDRLNRAPTIMLTAMKPFKSCIV